MLTTNQVVEIKKAIYNNKNMQSMIFMGAADAMFLKPETIEERPDGIHMTYKCSEVMDTDIFRSYIYSSMTHCLSETCPCIKDTDAKYCLINALRIDKNTFVAII